MLTFDQLFDHLKMQADRDLVAVSQQYENSRRIYNRVKENRALSATFLDDFTPYDIDIVIKRYSIAYACTCNGSGRLCHHVLSTLFTYKNHAETFFDLDRYIADLNRLPKRELVDKLRTIVSHQPEVLRYIGIEEFREPLVEEISMPKEFTGDNFVPTEEEFLLDALSELHLSYGGYEPEDDRDLLN